MPLLAELTISNLPYSEYWLPLLIGVGVGVAAILVIRPLVSRSGPVPQPQDKAAKQEFDPFSIGSPSEQRKAYRRGGHPVEVLYSLPDRKKQPFQGWVVDRSVGGLCLTVNQEFAEGTVLAVIPANAPPMTPWVEVEVRSCRAIDGQMELGCKFVKTPPWSILLLFG